MVKVHSIETFGTHDGPGIRLVVFVQGCQFRCLYCHNPDTQSFISKDAKAYTVDQLIELLERQRSYFGTTGGLTISGGEPTLQTPALIELFTEAKKRGFHTVLDTNGAIYSEQIHHLYDLTDLILLDVKHIDPMWHHKLTGAENKHVLTNALYREQSGRPMWLRYVLVPGWTDQEEHLYAWANHFASYKTIERVEILPYHTAGVHKYKALQLPYGLEGVLPPSPQLIEHVRNLFADYLPNVVVA